MDTLYTLLKTILLTCILAYCAPFFIVYLKHYYLPLLEPHTQVAVLSFNNIPTTISCLDELNYFFKNPAIKAILLKIDSATITPGMSTLIFHELQALKKNYPKPLCCLIENECLSGAYVIASSCDIIIAPEAAFIGKIGFYIIPEHMQTHVDEHINTELYQDTTKLVATARKLSLATVQNWANDKIITGRQAQKIGLVDTIGSLYTIELFLKEKMLCDDIIKWVTYQDMRYTFPISISLLATNVQ